MSESGRHHSNEEMKKRCVVGVCSTVGGHYFPNNGQQKESQAAAHKKLTYSTESCIILPIGFNLFLIEGTTIPFQIVLVPECQNIPALLDVRNGQGHCWMTALSDHFVKYICTCIS